MRYWFLFVGISLIGSKSWAYPDFIGYGYASCLTCHYNSQGNGPLTDYGRALFAQEIAARNFWTPKSTTDEEVAEKSGFIPGKELPSWVRPSIKYRGLWFQANPAGAQAIERWINMQRDVNLVFQTEDQRTVVVLNYGLLAKPGTDYYGNGEKTDAVSREHYLRFYLGEKLAVALGLMDIGYGLRTADHTSAGRGAIGLGQDDQVHGALFHWLEESWDASFHLFAGNLLESEEARRSGGAIQFEYSILESDRLGASLLYSKTETATSSRLAFHNRWGIPNAHGSSLLVELGLKQDQSGSTETKLGTYGLIQSVINLVRGYNLLTVIERAQSESKFSSPEVQRWTFGLLLFPFQRTEMRLTTVQYKTFSPSAAAADQWQIQGQAHVSW